LPQKKIESAIFLLKAMQRATAVYAPSAEFALQFGCRKKPNPPSPVGYNPWFGEHSHRQSDRIVLAMAHASLETKATIDA
jgi:hypothetical protein